GPETERPKVPARATDGLWPRNARARCGRRALPAILRLQRARVSKVAGGFLADFWERMMPMERLNKAVVWLAGAAIFLGLAIVYLNATLPANLLPNGYYFGRSD